MSIRASYQLTSTWPMQPTEQISQTEPVIAHTLDWEKGSQACLEQTLLPTSRCPKHLGQGHCE